MEKGLACGDCGQIYSIGHDGIYCEKCGCILHIITVEEVLERHGIKLAS